MIKSKAKNHVVKKYYPIRVKLPDCVPSKNNRNVFFSVVTTKMRKNILVSEELKKARIKGKKQQANGLELH